MQVDWELSQTLSSVDGQGIRAACVVALPPSSSSSSKKDDDDQHKNTCYRLIVGTQTGALQEFELPSGHITPVAYQHNHAVTALTACSGSDGRAVYVTGCKDAAIRVFDASTHELIVTLQGHEKPVTSLSWCKSSGSSSSSDYYLVSGSWDGTAKIWNMNSHSLVATLSGHENSVCCTGLPTASSSSSSSDNSSSLLHIATGSAGIAQNNVITGHTVRIWSVNPVSGETKLLHQVANDHEGPIRGICCLSTADADLAALVATCSNDGTVKLRSRETAICVSTLGFVSENQQHPPMLLGVSPVDGSTVLVACAEDGHVVLWDMQDGSSSGTSPPQIVPHAACVWNVVDLPNGDFGTCCDDGMFRIFSRATERFAPESERQAFATAVAQARQKQSGGPSPDEIAKLPRWEDNVQHHGTSEGQVQLFQKNGIAIAAQWSAASRSWIEVGQVMGSNDSGMIDGVSYDHVLPIEVEQTAGGDGANGVANLQIGYNNGENPFVAAQRFIDAHMLPQHHLAQIADYIQQRVGKSAPTLGEQGAAPSASTPAVGATTGVPIASFQYMPAKTYKTFELSEKTAKTTLEKMKIKITENGNLTKDELGRIDTLMQTLIATNRYHVSKVSSEELEVLASMLERLSPADAFPALDLARMVVLHPDAATSPERMPFWKRLVEKAIAMNETTAQGLVVVGPAAVAIPMLSLRLFANAFKGGAGSLEAVTSCLEQVLACTKRFVSSGNKNIRLSVATVLHNACFYLHSTSSSSTSAAMKTSLSMEIMSIANGILTSKTYEEEAVMRTLVGVGTLVMLNEDAKNAAKGVYMASKVEPAASPHGAHVKGAAKEVYALLS